MKIQKRIAALASALLLLLTMGAAAYALDVPDPARSGSLSVTMLCGGKAVPGGTLTLYRVGMISEDNGNYSFVLTGDFADSGEPLADISSPAAAAALAAYAANKGLTGTEIIIGNDGRAAIDGLSPGLYLVTQKTAAPGYEAVSPFLVSVPVYENGSYVYDVDATPKMGTVTEIPGTPTPSVAPSGPILPQTGQLNWPVPVLAVLGLGLFLLGFALRFGKKETPYET